ncbi:hypothetical protein CJ179_39200 [Rhodococcus sp. ACS1]|uniref:replication-relaxation family protein n=1 Tax=Rhodococcus sp. ACS1 TaxID=2028570 RepID=UPI000BB15977|nr:replication-relaxation family protein [Rhodococcus sp. ACS1]PBC38617.1 hypothetical protein CJ179_39200 [Rhodococcus sp. ACS1]
MTGNEGGASSTPTVRAGIRAASTHSATSVPVNAENRVLLDANDGAHSGTTHRPWRQTRQPIRDISALAKQLGERDWSILRSVATHRFLTVRQIQALQFGELPEASGLRAAQRVLARLHDQRLLSRLAQRIGGIQAGSSGLVYYIDDVGERLLRFDSGGSARRRFHEPTRRFLDHQLAIADVHVALVQADRQEQVELLKCDIEPTAWRQYVGMGGARLTLKPDLYAETAAPPGNEYVDSCFIEVDMGTESIPTLVKKCREYEAYRRLGIEQDRNDGAFPAVVWSMTASDPSKAERRRQALRQAIDADRNLRNDLFRIIAPNELVPLMQQGCQL